MKNSTQKLNFPAIPSHDKTLLSSGNSKIFISPAGDIHLQTAKAHLILTATGEIKLCGVEIQQQASQNVNLSADKNIFLNTDQS